MERPHRQGVVAPYHGPTQGLILARSVRHVVPWKAYNTITAGAWGTIRNNLTMVIKIEPPQIRRGNCNRLLGKGRALDLSIKCPRCGCINHVRAESSRQEYPECPAESIYAESGQPVQRGRSV